jgi:hypothetical protein
MTTLSRWAVLRAGVVASLHDGLVEARRAVGKGDTLDSVPEGVEVGAAWPEPRGRGRPAIGVRVEVRLPRDMHDRAKGIAARDGIALPEVLRVAIARGLR